MWFEELPKDYPWSSLWYGLIRCDTCLGVRNIDAECPCCEAPPANFGQPVSNAHAGAERSYEDYIYLDMMEREWIRPVSPEKGNQFQSPAPSSRAAIVILFWSYFETKIERLLRMGLAPNQPRLIEDALDRYSSIGARFDRLYRVAFNSTYAADLNTLGLSSVWAHLVEVQKRRNEFAHGNPRAIDDQLVEQVVRELKNEHDAWIAVFNLRVKASSVS